jgi:amidase
LTDAEYLARDALGLAELVERREVSAAELLELAIARAERINPRTGAIVRMRVEDARREAAANDLSRNPRTGSEPPAMRSVEQSSTSRDANPAPLRGVPFLVKDLDAAIAGMPLAAGSRFLADFRPPRESEIVRRFRRAGLVIFGQTTTPEFGITPYTEPDAFPPARNPWDLERTPGGSSGGAGAAVAAGIVPAAHASDGGGSIRIPASCCGLFGLKPTRGRTPLGPDASEIWSGFALGHALTRSVRDSAALLDAIAGPEPTSPYWAPPAARPFLAEVGAPPGRLRIALTKKPHLTTVAPHPDCAAAADDAGRLLASLGHHVEEADLDLDGEALVRDFFIRVCVEVATLAARAEEVMGRPARRGDFQASTAITATLGRQTSAVKAMLARERLDAAARRVAAFYERFDLVLSPTLGMPPPKLGALAPKGIEAFAQEVLLSLHLGFLLRLPGVVEASVRRVFSFIPFTPLANVTGQPAMSVPLAWNDAGLPIGVQLAARFGDEATLFRVAAQLEEARPWKTLRPSPDSSSGSSTAFGGRR